MIPENLEPKKVTIEDILRLKRAERPSPEFWGRFEQELRAKQLAAIVEKRPWWVTLQVPQLARYLARFNVPVGAAAVLVLSFIVVREYRPLTLSTYNGLTQVNPSIESSVDPKGASVTAVALASGKTVTGPAPLAAVETADTHALAVHADAPVSIGPGGLMAMIPWAPQTASTQEKQEPVILGELSPVHFLPALSSGRDHDFQGRVEVVESVVMPVRVAIAEDTAAASHGITAVVSPREVRRNRIMSNLVVADSASEIERSRVVQVRDVIASALDDDRLYDSVRRLGMGGDRLTLKF